MPLIIVIKPADGEPLRTQLLPGRNRVTVRVGDSYRIIDEATDRSPPGLVVRQVDSSLVVDGLDPGAATPPTVEFAEFYTLCSAGSPCALLVDPAGDAAAAPVAITPGTAPIGALSDGAFVLYDPAYAAPPAPAGGDGGVALRYGLYGLGGLAVLGLAAGGGGGGGGGSGNDGPVGGSPTPQPDGTLRLVTTDYNSRRPVLAGEGEAGSRVTVRIDTDGDGAVNVTYGATVGADLRWSVDLATATPESGTLPAGGLPDLATVAVSSSGPSGTASLAPMTIRFDAVPPAPATIDPIAGDGVVSGPEKAGGIVIAGSAEPGAIVTVGWAGQTVTVPVDAGGRWQAGFPAAAVPADGQSTVTAVVSDSAGNRSTVTEAAVAVDTRTAPLTLTAIAGDGLVTLADGDAFAFTGRAAPGAQVVIDWNGLSRGITAGADGGWEVRFAGPEIPTIDATRIPYTITTTTLIGNVGALAGSVVVDRVAPAAPAIGAVEGDDRVTQAERANGVTVAGTAGAGDVVEVGWGTATRTVTAGSDGGWAVTFSAGEVPAVGSPGAATTVTARATDPAGNPGPVARSTVYVEQPFPPPTIDAVAGNDVVNGSERGNGIVLSGTAPAGAGVVVSWGGYSATASVGGGRWQVVVPAGQVPADGSVPVVAAISGFPEISATRPVTIDTTAPPLPAIAAVAGDNVVTVAERGAPIVVSGTAEAGAAVSVSWGGTTLGTTAGGNGGWSVSFAPGQIPTVASGVDTVPVSVVATDTAGNTGAAASLAVQIVTPFAAPTIAVIETNDVVNAVERADGVVLSGTVAAGAPGVLVQWGSFSGTAAVDAGRWTITVPADSVPADGATTVTATVGGPAGGAAATRPVLVDTVGPAAPVVDPVTGDDSISSIENLTGFAVTGTGEAGATVTVAIGTATRTVAVGSDGHWSAGVFSTGGSSGPITLTALVTDAAGNPGTPTTRILDVQQPPVSVGPLSVDDPLANLLA